MYCFLLPFLYCVSQFVAGSALLLRQCSVNRNIPQPVAGMRDASSCRYTKHNGKNIRHYQGSH